MRLSAVFKNDLNEIVEKREKAVYRQAIIYKQKIYTENEFRM